MSGIVLILTESDRELVSGIPEYVEFDTNIPATVFYTLDGTTPDLSSLMAAERIYLPTSGTSVYLSAIAISGGASSSILEEEYVTDSTDLSGPRHIGSEGISILPFGEDAVDNMSYLVDGENAQETSIEFSSLDISASETSRSGTPNEGGLSVDFIKKAISPDTDTDFYGKRTTVNSASFNPKAGVIVIDGTSKEKAEEQVVRIVNRAYNSIDTVSKFYDENWKQQEQVITGNLVRSIYNSQTGIIAFFYWESKESRWLVSKQKVDPKEFRLKHSSGGRRGAGRFVYRWIQERSSSKIF
jgi:hypothetical protein